MRKKSTRLLSAALAVCMMLSVLPVGAFAAEPGTEPENGNGVSAQAEETLPFAGKEITEGGTYTMEGGEYTGPITVNVQDGKDVIINITGSVTTSIEDMLIKVVKGHVTINGGNNVTVENTREEKGYSDGIGYVLIGLSSTDDNTTVEINGGTYKRTLGAAVGCAYSSKGTLTIISGTFETSMDGAVVNAADDSAAVMQIEGGTFIGRERDDYHPAAYALENYGTTIIKGGDFQGYEGMVVYQSKGKLQIDGGTFELMNPDGSSVIYIQSGPSNTTITGGYFKNLQGCRWGDVVNYEFLSASSIWCHPVISSDIWFPLCKGKIHASTNNNLKYPRFFDAFFLYSVFSVWTAQMEIGGMFRRDAGQNAPLLRHKTKGKSRIMNQNQAKEYYKKLFVNYPDVLSVEEATTLLGFKSQTAIIRRIHQHRIRCLKVGRSFMIPKEYLIDYLLDS